MKTVACTLIALILGVLPALAQENAGFDRYFIDKTMRIDYFHIGDAEQEAVTIDRIYEYGTWAGSLKNLIDRLNYGAYYVKVYDTATQVLIYARGFDSYFKEYQTGEPAANGIARTFHETALIPFPKGSIVFALEKRGADGSMKEVFRAAIDPGDMDIIRNQGRDASVKIYQSLSSGDPHTKADVAIIAEGYTVAEEAKFKADLERFTGVFFKEEPCKSHKDHFNVCGVFKASQESGIDQPGHGSFKNTAVSATFNSMGSERYVLTEDNKALRDIAGHAPYDALYIMVNHHRYGGGGIYNFYCTFTSDNQWSEYLMVHEFGHSFFGLADEYYTSATAYDDFYPKGYEPSEPNITALLDPSNVKWKHLLSEGVPVPTLWEKEEYDTQDLAWQKKRRELNERIAELRRTGAPNAEAEAVEAEYNRLDREHTMKMHEYLSRCKRAGEVGAFEGAGYASTGLYRPMLNCIMFTKGTPQFCAVCRDAMARIIAWYAE
ncbi:MAG: peptidase M64 [Chitinivibrionia bacterium]|nr:peptidase M64 [Chitinivibrionia bacterium]